MRLIDVEDVALLKTVTDGGLSAKALWRRINSQPTVDAVPVIRCRECKFSKAYYHGPESNLGMFTYLCTQGLYDVNADDFCSMAERKDNETD